MTSKTYIKAALSILLVMLMLTAVLQIAVDPLFQYHTPWFGLKPVITNERYQNAGVARTFDFKNAIIGNSLAENFKVSDVSRAFGGETVKLTASGSHPLDWTYTLDVLSGRGKVPEHILFNLDPYIFLASSTELKHDLPKYLYDTDYLNDVNYLFNFSIINDFTYDTVRKNKNDQFPDYDAFMLWDDAHDYGRDFVLSHYSRDEISEAVPDIDGYVKNISDNLSLLLPYIEKMKDTEFVFFFSPFSMIYWDKQTRANSIEKEKAGYLKACEILSAYKNVTLYLWTDDEVFDVMTDLEYYCDEAHYNPEVCEMMAERIGNHEGIITKDNYVEAVDTLFEYIRGFDYESLFV